jgi:hypothetical protein
MQVGDLVRDRDFGDYGIITAIDKHGMYMVYFGDGSRDWLTDTFLEVIK